MLRNRSLATKSVFLLVSSIVILAMVPRAWAQHKYKTLHRFTGGADGGSPAAPLVFDAAGNLYGTTSYGGAHDRGTVFKLTRSQDGSWTESVLYNFCSLTNCTDGSVPSSGLTFDKAGNLYGETYGGGIGAGTVFELTPNLEGSWTEKILDQFNGTSDGGGPTGGLIFDQRGNLYGTTVGGIGFGKVFQLAPNVDGTWTENVLHTFPGGSWGADPETGVILDRAGNLYGTTYAGGNEDFGVVFHLTSSANGWTENVLHDFRDGFRDGENPEAGLIFDQAGNLYGTSADGGNSDQCFTVGCGVVFELSPNADGSWRESVLHHFSGDPDGGWPFAPVAFDQAGSLYGTTYIGGGGDHSCKAEYEPSACGVVFKLVPNSKGGWNETILHRFQDHPGALPYAGVIFDAAGNLYGTTWGDQSRTFGSVFEIAP
jgi:uncharacterized repeat protein (TIGR03803 family)